MRRNSSRILIGVSLAIAAAAAVVVVHVASPPPTPADTAPVTQSGASSAVTGAQYLPAVSNSSATEVNESVAPPEKPESEPIAAVAAVPVRLMPLDSKGTDATSALILDQFHATFGRRAAALPGVSLLSANETAPAGMYIEISMKLAGVRADGTRSISVPTMRMRGGQPETILHMDMLVAPGADLTQPVDNALNGLRTLLGLPGDPSVRNELSARMLDPAADRAAKQLAMSKLLAPSLKTADTAERKALYATALDLLAGGDPIAGDAIWRQLQNAISPELMDAASDALPASKDMALRRRLLTILSNTMRNLDNPRMSASMRAQSPEMMARMDAVALKVRAQLQSIAESDPNRLDRMIATRALTGDTEWNEFVVASLTSTTLADMERLEGFAYLGSAGMPVVAVNNPLLDDAAIRSAGELIIRMGRNPEQERQVLNAVNVLAAVRGEGGRDAAITVLRPGNGLSAASPVRAAMLVPLMMNKGADPAVRQTVEELATNDPDPLMRRRAGQVLQVADQLARDRMPLVLLQSSALIESATPDR
jgi:hypothetical protein